MQLVDLFFNSDNPTKLALYVPNLYAPTLRKVTGKLSGGT
jgi:hypothetical protein